MKKRSIAISLLLLTVSLLLTGCGGTGPSDSEVESIVRSGFWCRPGSLLYLETQTCDLSDIETSQCELTSNQRAEAGIDERWIVRFTLILGGGERVVPEDMTCLLYTSDAADE